MSSQSRKCLRFRWLLTGSLLLASLAPHAPAELLLGVPVRYGSAAVNDGITAAQQTHRYLMVGTGAGAQAGDVLRVTFKSDSCCGRYYHEIEVFDSTTAAVPSTRIQGSGQFTVTLANAGN